MKIHRICTLLLPLVLAAASITSTAATSDAGSGGRGDRAVSRSVGRSGGSVTYSGRGGYTRYGGGRHGSHFSGSVWIGPGWGYYDPFFYPYYYSYPSYPYYYSPPAVVVPQEPQEYISPDTQEEQGGQYWYYCRKPQGYYPYVERCPGGWLKVVPDTTPPSQEQEDEEE